MCKICDINRRMAHSNLNEMASLETNWDSHGGSVISPKAITRARNLIDEYEMSPPDHVTPLSSGGVQLEWDGSDMEAEVEINTNGEIFAFFVAKDRCVS